VKDADGSHLARVASDGTAGGSGRDQLVSAAVVNAHDGGDLAARWRVASLGRQPLDDGDELGLSRRQRWR
jgi:hypothetical protein